MILIDTSIWIDHLKRELNSLIILLNDGQVLCHPFVLVELALGNLANRQEILTLLSALPQAEMVEHGELLHFVEVNRIYGRGLGWVDVHLLASAFLTGCQLWTRDKKLSAVATKLKIAHHR